ncbi:MAG: hypothetical protein LBD49_01765 [Oscillospiraceae bacterium]|jgi:hypothetical protein|nr:hypothetical protein [Oscillospiraceae bacterium]
MSVKPTVGEVWWNRIAGVSQFLRDVSAALCDEQNVYIYAPGKLPWEDEFGAALRDELSENIGAVDINYITDAAQDPAEALLDYAGIRSEYRRTVGISSFLQQKRAFSNQIISVSPASDKSARRWFELARTHRAAFDSMGPLFIRSSAPAPAIAQPKHMRVIRYSDYASEYDTLVFAELILPRHTLSDVSKRYVAALAVALFGTDAETVAMFAETFDITKDDPQTFAAERLGDAADITSRIWNAQIQILFPLIMRGWRVFMSVWQDRLSEAFEVASRLLPHGVEYCGETVTSADEMELGTILYLMRSRPSDDAGHFLYIPDDAARAQINLLHETRNTLAHGKVCRAVKVRELLGIN